MTTPSINTPNSIILDAYSDAGLVAIGDDISSEQYAIGLRRLRDLINTMQLRGLKLWVNVLTEVPLTANQATYTFGPSGSVNMTKPMRVIQGLYQDDSDPPNRRPLIPLSWNDYLTLSQVEQTGAINSYFEDKQQTVISVTFWPVPDTEAATGSVYLLLQTQITNPTELDETMNFPEEWRMALRWGLAADLCTGQPAAIIERCEGKAGYYMELLEAWDVEDAPTQFTPDPRARYGGGSAFR